MTGFRYPSDDNPVDILEGTAEVISLLASLFANEHASELMGDSELGGLSRMLNTAKADIDAARAIVEERILDPFDAGYRKGMTFAAKEYRRGFAEGQSAADRSKKEARLNFIVALSEAVQEGSDHGTQ